MSVHNAEVLLLWVPKNHFSEQSFLVCQNFQNWLIISVNNHFSVSEFSQKRQSFWVSYPWSSRALNRTMSVFGKVNKVVPTRSLHQTITWSTGNQLEGSGPKFMSLSSSLLSKLITRSNRKQIGANWLRLQRMLRLHTTRPNTERHKRHVYTFLLCIRLPSSRAHLLFRFRIFWNDDIPAWWRKDPFNHFSE